MYLCPFRSRTEEERFDCKSLGVYLKKVDEYSSGHSSDAVLCQNVPGNCEFMLHALWHGSAIVFKVCDPENTIFDCEAHLSEGFINVFPRQAKPGYTQMNKYHIKLNKLMLACIRLSACVYTINVLAESTTDPDRR